MTRTASFVARSERTTVRGCNRCPVCPHVVRVRHEIIEPADEIVPRRSARRNVARRLWPRHVRRNQRPAHNHGDKDNQLHCPTVRLSGGHTTIRHIPVDSSPSPSTSPLE